MALEDESAKRAFLAETINDASIDCVIAMDRELRVTSWNKACETLSGKLKENVLGKRLNEIFPDLTVSKAFTKALANALLGLKSFVPVKEGSMEGEYMETHVIPLTDELKQVVGVLIIRHDVAHRQYAEQELKRLNNELAQRNAELISFAKVTSHDLKEPLRKVNLFTHMLMERDRAAMSDDSLSLLTRIQKSAKKAEALTDDVFTFWQLQKVSEPLAEVDLSMVIRMLKQQLHSEIGHSGASIDLEKLPVVLGYRMLIYQLFQNIIENALKFQLPGILPHIIIRSEFTAEVKPDHPDALPGANYAKVSFTDNGIGFDQQYADRIFELFQRLHVREEYAGNGIGLSLCRKIMSLHNGFITAESKPNGGSTFSCFFPSISSG